MQIHPGDEELLPPNSQQSLLGTDSHAGIVTNYASIIVCRRKRGEKVRYFELNTKNGNSVKAG